MTKNYPFAVSGDEFKGKRVVVTGGTKGIGEAIVRRFELSGASVATTARSELAPGQCPVLFIKADLGTSRGVQNVVDRVLQEWGGLDVLVNNVGGTETRPGGFEVLSDEDWQRTDFDFKRSVVLIQRSAVGKRVNKLKTEYSEDEVPLERGFILELQKWQAVCPVSAETWVFPSPITGRPYHADSIRAKHLVPASLKLGLGRIGFHVFRHSYRAWLDETGAPLGVQQKFMRHAHISTTMDHYGNASIEAKRKANWPVIQRLLKRPAAQPVSIQ